MAENEDDDNSFKMATKTSLPGAQQSSILQDAAAAKITRHTSSSNRRSLSELEDAVQSKLRQGATENEFIVEERTSSSSQAANGRRNDDLVYGVYGGENEENLAVAVEVEDPDETVLCSFNSDGYLPSGVQLDPDFKPSESPFWAGKRRVWIITTAVILFLIAVVIVVTTVLLIRKDNEDDPPPPYRTTLGIQEKIASAYGDSADLILDAPEQSPYRKALDWIMLKDPAERLPDDPSLVQRYVLAYLYFATSTEKPWAYCTPPGFRDKDDCVFALVLPRTMNTVDLRTNRWLSGVHECTWAGVECDSENQNQVDSLRLSGMIMTGSFPEGIWPLRNLHTLELAVGELHGSLPTVVTQMEQLKTLVLSRNSFTGSIPKEYYQWQRLRYLDLGYNGLTGTLSSEIAKLANIEFLLLGGTRLSGQIPNEIGDLDQLRLFHMEKSAISGRIPSSIFQLSNLERLRLQYNQLTGPLPESGNVPELYNLGLAKNALSGELPDYLFETRMDWLELGGCQFSGTLSTKIGLLNEMYFLNLQDNRFEGRLPTELGQLTVLLQVELSGNYFTGTVPSQLCALRNSPFLEDIEADCLLTPDSEGRVFCPGDCCTICCEPGNSDNCLEMQ